MNKLIPALLAALMLASCAPKKDVYLFTSFLEPSVNGMNYLYSLDGYKWEPLGDVWMMPEIGNDKPYINRYNGMEQVPKYMPVRVLRDPSILQGPDGTFHLVWTTQWSGSRGFGYASSKDLIHWSEQREIPVMADSLTNNVWAPELFYDDVKKEFYVIWSSQIPPSRYTDLDRLGTNACHRPYYTKTKDFVNWTPAQPFYDCGYNSIDGFLVKKGRNDYVFIVKDNRKPGFSNCFAVFGDSPEGPFTDPTEPFSPEYSEGPCVIKVGDEWLIYYDVYREVRYGAVSTRDFKTFTPIDDKISIPRGYKHGTMIAITRKQLKKLQEAAAVQPKHVPIVPPEN